MTIRIEPYKAASKGAKALSRYSGILRATRKQVQRHGTFDTVLNWGNSERRFHDAEYINDPEAVAIASDKLQSCRRFREEHVNQPPYTTQRSIAEEWLNSGTGILARRLTRACGGRGITRYTGGKHSPRVPEGEADRPEFDGVISRPGEPAAGRRSKSQPNSINAEVVASASGLRQPVASGDGRSVASGDGRCSPRRRIVDAPLYTKYIKKADEYRIHVFDGRVIDVQQKRKRRSIPNEEIDYQIRNTAGGWVYCRDNVDCPTSCNDLAIRAVAALGLDFGAVDIGYNRHDKSPCVYEVNTAPGLEGTTLTKYREAIERRLPQIGRGTYAKRRQYGGGGAW